VPLYHEAGGIHKRLSLTRNGQVRYELKTPWRNGTTHVIFEPLEFIFWFGFPGDQAQSQSARSHHPNEWGGVLRQRTGFGRFLLYVIAETD
jgi:hypothetical protein